MVNWKEVAKFASGLTAWEAIAHASLGLNGVLPLTLFGITITPTINTVQIIIPAVVSITLAYYAWFKK
ncbi:MAG: hypothetical protein V1802_01455 [Candidatus Aenigmatarchaeota archaeon]